MKSNSAPTSMMMPKSVEMAPCITGANMCWIDIVIRLLREPIAVRKPCKSNIKVRQVGRTKSDFVLHPLIISPESIPDKQLIIEYNM